MPQHRPRRIADKNRGFRHKTSARFADKPRTGGIPFIGRCSPYDGKGWRITDRNDSTESCNERINILSVVLQNPYIIVWQDYAGEYICGAAHGMYANRYVNYSLKTNRMLKLADLFKPKYEKRADRSHTCEAGRQQRHNGRTEPDRNPGTVPHNP